MDFVIKGFLTGLTPSEKWFLLTHPHLVGTIRDDANKALVEAQRRFAGARLHNGTGDAFRHCYWSALLGRDIGKDNATEFTTAHESWSGNPPRERAMDLHNNAIGVDIGASNPKAKDAQLIAICQAEIKSGRLQTTLAASKPYQY